jgi:hypothetical protein
MHGRCSFIAPDHHRWRSRSGHIARRIRGKIEDHVVQRVGGEQSFAAERAKIGFALFAVQPVFGQFGQHIAGADDIDIDAVRHPFTGKGFTKMIDGGFGRGLGGVPRSG